MEALPVYIVEDDADLAASIAVRLTTGCGYDCRIFDNAEDFLSVSTSLPSGCVVVDHGLPGKSGLEVVQTLSDGVSRHARIMLTGIGDISLAIKAMRAGADDFLEKPVDGAALAHAIEAATQRHAEGSAQKRQQNAMERVRSLKPREIDVMRCVAEGLPNKLISHRLDLSVRTVEHFRRSMMAQLRVDSVAEILRLAYLSGIASP